MKKLIETPEAELYSSEIRAKVVDLAGLQLLVEWRYWMILVPFLIVGIIAMRMVEWMGLPLIERCAVTFLIVLPAALLWSRISWRMHRWVLEYRREALLHAVGGEPSAPVDPPNCGSPP